MNNNIINILPQSLHHGVWLVMIVMLVKLSELVEPEANRLVRRIMDFITSWLIMSDQDST